MKIQKINLDLVLPYNQKTHPPPPPNTHPPTTANFFFGGNGFYDVFQDIFTPVTWGQYPIDKKIQPIYLTQPNLTQLRFNLQGHYRRSCINQKTIRHDVPIRVKVCWGRIYFSQGNIGLTILLLTFSNSITSYNT